VIFCSVPAASAITEDLQGAAGYLAAHVKRGDEIALPDHSVAAGIDYYLQHDHTTLARWPQLQDQRYIERFDLDQSSQVIARAPKNVWLVNDGFTTGTETFLFELWLNHYELVRTMDFTGVQVVHLRRKD
jgi:hypothetical protein